MANHDELADKDTVSIHFVTSAVSQLSDAARMRVLRDAGIPPEWLHGAQTRVPAAAFSALWLSVAREMDDEFFGLDRRRMKVGSFALLTHASLHSDNLEHALRRLLRGFRVILDDVAAELSIHGDEALLTIRSRVDGQERRRFAEETFLVLLYGLVCWLIGRRIPLKRVDFSHPRPPYAQEYVNMFCDNLRFDAPVTAVRFEQHWLQAPVIQNASTVGAFLLSTPQAVFLKYRNEDSWTARLRRLLRDGMERQDWPSLETTAQGFNVAPTTLRRKLEAEGTNFQEVKDELRRDTAIHHLCRTSTSIADIATLLGYHEISAFYRAFKKWTGLQPGEYRQKSGLA